MIGHVAPPARWRDAGCTIGTALSSDGHSFYHLTRNGQLWDCECEGYRLFRKTCRHIKVLQAQIPASVLAAEQARRPPATPRPNIADPFPCADCVWRPALSTGIRCRDCEQRHRLRTGQELLPKRARRTTAPRRDHVPAEIAA